MNWVGGARRRIKGFSRTDRKIQKEYFERKRFNAKAYKVENRDSKTKVKDKPISSKRESKVSQDLVAFQMARLATQKRGGNGQANFRVLDLGKKKTAPGMSVIGGKLIQTVDLPLSPQETPSVLNLSGSSGGSGFRGSTKKSDNSLQFQKERTKIDQLPLFFDSKHKEDPLSKKSLFMDFLGEKMPVPMSKPQKERPNQQREHLYYPNKQQSVDCGYQTDQSSRYVCSQIPSLGHYDADSDVSSFISNFPHKQRFTEKTDILVADSSQTQANWWAQIAPRKEHRILHARSLPNPSDQILMPHSETRGVYLRSPHDVQHSSSHDNVVQEVLTHQISHSPLMKCKRGKSVNDSSFISLEDTDTTSPGSFFSREPPYYNDPNVHHQYMQGKCLNSPLFFSPNNEPEERIREQSSPCSLSFPNNNAGLQEHSAHKSISSLLNPGISRQLKNKSRTVDIPDSILNYPLDTNNRTNPSLCQYSELSFCRPEKLKNTKDHASKSWDNHQSYKTRCYAPVAPAEAPNQKYALAAATTPISSTPVNYRSSYGDCVETQRVREPQPPDTASTSTFPVSRRDRVSSASNIYLEVCSLEDQVPLQKSQKGKISDKKSHSKINDAIERRPVRNDNSDSDVVKLVNQMVDYVVMDNILHSVLDRKHEGQASVNHHLSKLNLLTEDRVQICDSSSKSPLSFPCKKVCLNPLLNETAQMTPTPTKSVKSVGCETDRPGLVDAACSPLRVVCSHFQAQRRYNTRRYVKGLHVNSKLSPHAQTHRRKSKKTPSEGKQVEKENEETKQGDIRQLILTQPED